MITRRSLCSSFFLPAKGVCGEMMAPIYIYILSVSFPVSFLLLQLEITESRRALSCVGALLRRGTLLNRAAKDPRIRPSSKPQSTQTEGPLEEPSEAPLSPICALQ